MTLRLNTAVAAIVTAYDFGPEETDSEGNAYHPVIGIKPGSRLDVQRETIALHPALASFHVEPQNPIHDPGPNGVRLFADDIEAFQVAVPPSNPPNPWDLFYTEEDET